MTIIDNDLLADFRMSPKCEYCGKYTPSGGHVHHIEARGMGSGKRLDVRENLIFLCAVPCHQDVHDGRILRCDLLAVVAMRESKTQDQIERMIYELLRTPNRPIGR